MESVLLSKTFWAILMLALIVVPGMIIGAWYRRHAAGPRERAYIHRVWPGVVALLCLFVLALIYLPSPWRYGALAVALLAFPLAIRQWAILHFLIRQLDERDEQQRDGEREP